MTARYKYAQAWTHPRVNVNGSVFAHVLVAERALGHYLPPRAEVHHVNENKKDNRPGNLVICEDHAYHMLLHRRLRALKACGNASWLRCNYCKGYDEPNAITVNLLNGATTASYHKQCAAKFSQYKRDLATGRRTPGDWQQPAAA